MDIVKYVQENKHRFKNYEWLKQFDPDTDGYRFTPMKFMGMQLKYGMDEVMDGIGGDRWMRQHLKTGVMDGITADHFRRGLTPEELNDILNYYAWTTFDILGLRATEGRNELIPRQEYEFLAFNRIFARNPEFLKLAVHKVGWESIVRRQSLGRKELGSKIEHQPLGVWCTLACPIFGAVGLEALGHIDPDDPLVVEKKRWVITMTALRGYVQRAGDGTILGSQSRYSWDKDQSVLDFIQSNLEPMDDAKSKLFWQLDASANLLGFLIHYDCRAGLNDTGPYIVEDGKPMIIRTIFINEPAYSWSEVAERRSLPYALVMAFVINPEKVGLQEMRVNDAGTTFTRPVNISAGMEQACMFVRYETEGTEPLPLSKLQKISWSDIPDLVAKCNDGIAEWYAEVAKMPRRLKIFNGYQVYSADAAAIWGSFMRPLGLSEYCEEELDFWELPPMASETYYQATGKVVTEVVPVNIFTGFGWSDIPKTVPLVSRYRAYLSRARDLGWVSDLSGTRPIPDDLKDRVDEDGSLRVPLEIPNYTDDWLK